MEQTLISELIETKNRLTGWLVEHAYPMWWKIGADHETGGFVERINLDGSPTAEARRFRVQPRQVYCYSNAIELGWIGPAGSAVAHGWRYFERVYRRPNGLFGTLANFEGKLCDERADLYDQAFALLAYAAIAHALPEEAPKAKLNAEALLGHLRHFRHPDLGFREIDDPVAPLRSNPHMHLFEAALAWDALDEGSQWSELCEEIASLCLSKLIPYRGAGLRENFTQDWGVQPGLSGEIVEPGHQFEWAWLLERWGKKTGNATVQEASRHLFHIGESTGIDPSRGMAVAAVLDGGGTHDPIARLWPQTERLKASLLLADSSRSISDRTRYLMSAKEAASALLQFLDVPQPGLWRDKSLPDGTFINEPAPASSFYHIVAAIAELSNTLARLRPPA